MTLKVFLHMLPYLVVIGICMYVLNAIHDDGFDKGAISVQTKWDKQALVDRLAADKLKKENAQKEAQHRAENTRVTHELAESQKNYELDISTIGSKYEHRLLLSTQRANSYKRQAESGAIECRDLASHAARLDSTLEEGRTLVHEFGTTVRLRDNQIMGLSNQILNDRKLISE